MRRSLNYPALAVWLLTLLLAASTGRRVFYAPLWGDEFRTWRDGIEKPLGAVLTWTHNPDHAPLGHLLARAGAAIFGVEHAWALRLGAWLCGLACVPAIYLMGRTLGRGASLATADEGEDGRTAASWVGCAMALMLVVDPSVNFQITQARMYAPLLLGAIVAMTLTGSILLRPERAWARVVGLGVALGACVWSHSQIYALLIGLLIVTLALLARHPRTAGALLVALAIGCSIGAQGILKIAARADAEAVESAEVADPPAEQLENAMNRLTGGKALSAVVAAASAGGLVVLARRPGGAWLAALLVAIVGMALVNLLVAARYRPVNNARYLMIVQPALWLAIACLVVALCRAPRWRSSLGVGGALALVGLCAFAFARTLGAMGNHPLAEPFARLCRDAHRFVKPGDRFVVVPRQPYVMYARYYGLTQDTRLDGALLRDQSMRSIRRRLDESGIGRRTVYQMSLVPPQNIPYTQPIDDPRTLARMIAEAKEVAVDPLEKLVQGPTWQAALVRIDTRGTTIVAERWPENAVTTTAATRTDRLGASADELLPEPPR